MKKHLLSDAISNIDQNLIENYFIYKEELKTKSSKSFIKYIAALAACFIIVTSGIFIGFSLFEKNGNSFDKSPPGNMGADSGPGVNNGIGESSGPTTNEFGFEIGESYNVLNQDGKIESIFVSNIYLTEKIGIHNGRFIIIQCQFDTLYCGVKLEHLSIYEYSGEKDIVFDDTAKTIMKELNKDTLDDNLFIDSLSGEFFIVYSLPEDDFVILKNKIDSKEDLLSKYKITIYISTSFSEDFIRFFCQPEDIEYVTEFSR